MGHDPAFLKVDMMSHRNRYKLKAITPGFWAVVDVLLLCNVIDVWIKYMQPTPLTTHMFVCHAELLLWCCCWLPAFTHKRQHNIKQPLKQRISEHKTAIHTGNMDYAVTKHYAETNHSSPSSLKFCRTEGVMMNYSLKASVLVSAVADGDAHHCNPAKHNIFSRCSCLKVFIYFYILSFQVVTVTENRALECE